LNPHCNREFQFSNIHQLLLQSLLLRRFSRPGPRPIHLLTFVIMRSWHSPGLRTGEKVICMPVEALAICPECEVPDMLVLSYNWLNSGVMVVVTNQTQRMILVESENLDPLFKGISEVIGSSIEMHVTDICRRATSSVVKSMVTREIKDLIVKKEVDLHPIIMGLTDVMITTSQIMGYGKFEIVGYRYENDEHDHFTNRVKKPYSVPLCRGNLAGTLEGIYEKESIVESREVAPGVYEQTAHLGAHARELEKRLKLKPYHHRDGDVELERCPTCGGPGALASYQWLIKEGIIINKITGRRLALIDPDVLDAVFEELEAEVGETVPRAVVEAQRNFIKSSSYSIDEISHEEDFRNQLAVRGYGNLREIQLGQDGISLSIDNAAAHLMIVGMVQGLFEMALDVESNAEWEISEEQDLKIQVTPKGV
jgi:hypothetical protein